MPLFVLPDSAPSAVQVVVRRQVSLLGRVVRRLRLVSLLCQRTILPLRERRRGRRRGRSTQRTPLPPTPPAAVVFHDVLRRRSLFVRSQPPPDGPLGLSGLFDSGPALFALLLASPRRCQSGGNVLPKVHSARMPVRSTAAAAAKAATFPTTTDIQQNCRRRPASAQFWQKTFRYLKKGKKIHDMCGSASLFFLLRRRDTFWIFFFFVKTNNLTLTQPKRTGHPQAFFLSLSLFWPVASSYVDIHMCVFVKNKNAKSTNEKKKEKSLPPVTHFHLTTPLSSQKSSV